MWHERVETIFDFRSYNCLLHPDISGLGVNVDKLPLIN